MSRRRIGRALMLLAGLLAGAAIFTAAAAEMTESGAPWIAGSPGTAPAPRTGEDAVPAPPPALDDLLQPLVHPAPPGLPIARERVEAAGPAAVPPTPLWEHLAALPASRRPDATIEIEPGADRSPDLLRQAAAAAALWNGGQHDAAVEALKSLEEEGPGLGLGIAWRGGAGTACLREGADVRIGTDTGAARARLDFHRGNGNLFSVIRWGSTTGTASWSMHLSTDDGATWSMTYQWSSGTGIVDVDLAVVGSYAYVAYVAGSAPSEARLRRCYAANGAVDAAYGFQVAIGGGVAAMTEVALAANPDDGNNRIYYCAMQDDLDLRYAWDEASDGTTFIEEPCAIITRASAGLDATYNHNPDCYAFFYMSFADTAGAIHVRGRTQIGTWIDDTVEFDVGRYRATSLSWWGTNVLCAFEYPNATGIGISYRISYDCGDNWNPGALAVPDGTTIAGYFDPQVDLRNGLGTAIVYQAEAGTFDPVIYRVRPGFAPGGWQPPVEFNDFDVLTGSPLALSALPSGPDALWHGAIYLTAVGIPYFDRPGPAVVDAPVVSPPATSLRLFPPAPSPSSGTTVLRFAVPAAGRARLQVFDVLGRHVATLLDRPVDAGIHALPFDASALRSGVYYGRLSVGEEEVTNRITVIR